MHIVQPRTFNPRKTLFVGAVILILIIVTITRNAPPGPANIHWVGPTMGTYYDIKIAHSPLSEVEARQLYMKVEKYLRDINDQMSTYILDSEISRFNRHESTVPYPVSPSFATVTASAIFWAERTDGAFDPTLDPLLNIWGFGHNRSVPLPPSDDDIDEARQRSGWQQIEIINGPYLQKGNPELQLNLNAIAKGYAVDGVLDLILKAGVANVYVEIGGDVAAMGVNREGNPWRIGIELPVADSAPSEYLHGIAHLSSGALAGSGGYRNFVVDEDGQTWTHILDPRTARPVQHALASVNVWAATCIDADAIATALIVMGPIDGPEWIETIPEAEALFFIRQPDGAFKPVASSGFAEATGLQLLDRF